MPLSRVDEKLTRKERRRYRARLHFLPAAGDLAWAFGGGCSTRPRSRRRSTSTAKTDRKTSVEIRSDARGARSEERDDDGGDDDDAVVVVSRSFVEK